MAGLQIEFPFTAWDILAGTLQSLGMFWNACSPGPRVAVCLLAVLGFVMPAQRATKPRRRSRRRRHHYDF